MALGLLAEDLLASFFAELFLLCLSLSLLDVVNCVTLFADVFLGNLSLLFDLIKSHSNNSFLDPDPPDSSPLWSIAWLNLLVLPSPGSGPTNFMGLCLVFIKVHRLLIDVKIDFPIPCNVTDTTTRVDFKFRELTLFCTDNHFLLISLLRFKLIIKKIL